MCMGELFYTKMCTSFSFADMKKILELDPTNDQARKAIRRLEPLAEAKREKMKEEMIGKSIIEFRSIYTPYVRFLVLFLCCGH